MSLLGSTKMFDGIKYICLDVCENEIKVYPVGSNGSHYQTWSIDRWLGVEAK